MPQSHFIIANTPQQLEQLSSQLSQESIIGVDSEANSLHAYRERLCLLQFSTPKLDAVVDPLALPKLGSLEPLFSDATIEKVFHAAEYDLIVLHRDLGFKLSNLFDTMVAARILGRKKVGLGNLLEEEFGIQLEKRYQRADWGQRPLRPEMLEYARLDTHYLIELRHKLKAELEARERWEVAREDFARQPGLIPALAEPPNQDIWRIKGARDLTPRQAAILQELVVYRESRAAQADQPLFKVMGDATLSAIALAGAKTAKDLEEIPGMTPGQIRRHGPGLLAAVRRGERAEPLRRPRRAPYDEAYVERLDKLRAWRKEAAKEMDVESDVVLPKDLMQAVAKANPTTPEAVAGLLAEVPWRLARYGEQILAALKPAQG
ncbi:MAG: HRDC domain-containing protein [Anaerolineales bacterium]|nr:HRDC domain-containing protein [Anaerolineales bacterium]